MTKEIKSGEFLLKKDGTVVVRKNKYFHLPDIPSYVEKKYQESESLSSMPLFPLSLFDFPWGDFSLKKWLENKRKIKQFKQKELEKYHALKALWLIQAYITKNNIPATNFIGILIATRLRIERAFLSQREQRSLRNLRNPVVQKAYEFEIRQDGEIDKVPHTSYRVPKFPKSKLFKMDTEVSSDVNLRNWYRELDNVAEMNALKKQSWEASHNRQHRQYQLRYYAQSLRMFWEYMTSRSR